MVKDTSIWKHHKNTTCLKGVSCHQGVKVLNWSSIYQSKWLIFIVTYFNSTGILHTFDLSYFNQLNKKVIENVCIVVFTILSYCDFFSSCSFHFNCGFSKCICHASFWICIIRDLFSGPHVSLILYSCIILDVKLVYIYFKILTMDNLSTHKIKNNIKGSVVAL